ncbi:MAG: PilZ domain-containing protein [Clostridiales bacterium]|jgi:hypothetical protein|nr:PilZ domain-containing protein [Clostridiales bacterium]
MTLTSVKFLDAGLIMEAQTLTDDNKIDSEYEIKFIESCSDGLDFLVENDALAELFAQRSKPTYLKIKFFRSSWQHTFTAKTKSVTAADGKTLVRLTQISPIESLSRRQSPRHELKANLKVYEKFDPNAEGVYDLNNKPALYSGNIFDISGEGLCVLTNRSLDLVKGSVYILRLSLITDFTLNKEEHFVFSAKLTRIGNAPQSVQYKFDYGFLFDFTSGKDEKSRLVTAIFMHKKGLA